MMNSKPISEDASTATLSRRCATAFGGVFLIAGVFAVWFSFLAPSLHWWQARSWPQSTGKVTVSRVDTGDDTSSAHIEFDLNVNGRPYHSDSFSFSVWSGSDNYARRICNQYPVGSVHDCYYNPSDPNDAVLDRSFVYSNLIGLFFMVFVIAGLVVIWAGYAKPKSNRRAVSNVGIAGSTNANPVQAGSRFGSMTMETYESSMVGPWAGEFGPKRLKSSKTPLKQFLFVLVFTLIWNAMTWGMFRGGGSQQGWFRLEMIFYGVFMFAGAVLAIVTVVQFLLLLNPKISIALSSGVIPLGGEAEVAWETSGGITRFSELTITLVGVESATYAFGTRTKTDTEEFFLQELARVNDSKTIAYGNQTIQIPSQAMHTFHSTNNRIQWLLRVHGKIRFWPDSKEDFAFVVCPVSEYQVDSEGSN
ncbi:MAG: DUF3592 domain-containing protein [Pirellulaceae bacterium]